MGHINSTNVYYSSVEVQTI